MNNQEGINTKSNKKKWIWGCGGCLGIFIILAIIFGACSAVFVNSVDEEVNGTKEEQKKNKKTSEKRYKVGDDVTIKDVQFKLVDAYYTDERNEFTDVEADKVLVVDMEIKNNGDEDIPVGTDVKAYADGKQLESYPVDDELLDGLSPGRSIQGKTGFAITGNPKKLELEFSPFADFSGTKAIYNLEP
ncbi:DUF5067 domain-containing protein [Mammaliicoccus sp. N-M51]|uniref:DUF5067 domain-containing protein n=1 Tax=Mammaliicoccus sp. N-M51 TaxID=2898710 RepID=UPI001EFB1AAB|nr:DUF5067 domain-containing protein [Mammaliicoccus sp. N-M51]